MEISMTSEDIIAKMALWKVDKKKIYTNSNILFSKYPYKKWSALESKNSLIIVFKFYTRV